MTCGQVLDCFHEGSKSTALESLPKKPKKNTPPLSSWLAHTFFCPPLSRPPQSGKNSRRLSTVKVLVVHPHQRNQLHSCQTEIRVVGHLRTRLQTCRNKVLYDIVSCSSASLESQPLSKTQHGTNVFISFFIYIQVIPSPTEPPLSLCTAFLASVETFRLRGRKSIPPCSK